jgi:hypothetical protein
LPRRKAEDDGLRNNCVHTGADFADRVQAWVRSRPAVIVILDNPQHNPLDSNRPAARGIEQSTLIEYHDAAHGLFATEKERFTKDLLSFIK